MKEKFGTLPNGECAWLYTIAAGKLTAVISDFGATLVRLYVPDRNGRLADVVLGFDSPAAYAASDTLCGAVVGRSTNRIQGASVVISGKQYALPANENGNSLHSGPDFYKDRLWQVTEHTKCSISLRLHSPDGDQGFPGNAVIDVTYMLEIDGTLRISYRGVCDRDTVFNLTNHTFFNLAGHDKTEAAMEQLLFMPSSVYTPCDHTWVPTGELRNVEGTPMDFRIPKPIGRDIAADYDSLNLQDGYDHNYEVCAAPCAILTDPNSGRSMEVYTDCPGVQLYTGNFLSGEQGKDGVVYTRRSGVCLETQYYPDAVHHNQWAQPITAAGTTYHSETCYRFQ